MAKPSTYRVALAGFSDFERQALVFCFRHAQDRISHYELTANLAEAELIVTDGDSTDAVASVVLGARTPLVVFVGRAAPAGALVQVPRPIDPVRILRSLDDLVAGHGAELAALAALANTPIPPPRLVQVPEPVPSADPPAAALPVSRPENLGAPRMALSAAVALDGVPAAPPPARPSAKDSMRRAVRRARRAAAGDSTYTLTDVLVLDRDEAARDHLSALLRAFGFTVHPAATNAQAAVLLGIHQLAAAFLDIVLDDSDGGEGVALCRLARKPSQADVHWTQALVVVSGQVKSTDPVRARLAGADVHLVKPLSRGDVARALEACGVALPADARS